MKKEIEKKIMQIKYSKNECKKNSKKLMKNKWEEVEQKKKLAQNSENQIKRAKCKKSKNRQKMPKYPEKKMTEMEKKTIKKFEGIEKNYILPVWLLGNNRRWNFNQTRSLTPDQKVPNGNINRRRFHRRDMRQRPIIHNLQTNIIQQNLPLKKKKNCFPKEKKKLP